MHSQSKPDVANPLVVKRRREYATSFARAVTGAPTKLPHDIADFVWRALARSEEIESADRDRWGNWELEFSGRAKNTAMVPAVDQVLLNSNLSADSTRRREGLWPGKKSFALCLTHDVDGVTSRNHLRRFMRRVARAGTARGPRHYALLQAAGSLYRLASEPGQADRLGRFEDWLDAESSYGFKSTWFFLPGEYGIAHVYDMDYNYADDVVFKGVRMSVAQLIRALKDSGAEIGLHGSYLSSTDAMLLAKQKAQLEAVVSEPLTSIRQHYLRYDVELTPQAHQAAGFSVDSTQGFNSSIGFRAGTAFPYLTWDHSTERPTDVLEVPLQIMDGPLLRAAGNSPVKSIALAIQLMDAVVEVGGCLTLNWHPNLIDRPHFFAVYKELLAAAAERNAWGCSARELSSWWLRRKAPFTPDFSA